MYGPAGYAPIESCAYLGIVTLLLIGYAALWRVPFSRARYWWLAFALLALLSLGAYWKVGDHQIPLPGLWLWKVFPALRMIRSPARFNLLACLLASLLAAAGLRHLLSRIEKRWARVTLFVVLGCAAVAEMSIRPFPSDPVRPMPACYDWIRRHDPQATIMDAPLVSSGALTP